MGSKLLLVRKNNEVLDHIAKACRYLCCQSEGASTKPLPAAAVSLSGLDNFNEDDDGDDDTPAPKDFTLLQAFLTLKNRYTNRRRQLADLSVEQAVLEYVTTSDEPLTGQYVKKGETGDIVADGDLVDMRAEFAAYLPKLRTTLLNEKDQDKNPAWSKDDRRKVKQAYRVCRDEVIAQTPILIATVYAAAPRDYAHFGLNAYHYRSQEHRR